ncbi:AMP-binding protein [Halobellus rarus]|uniref:AMP-binding protein n=1 Tax=Halobellus rarus TaxID=1126237 RepID=A0ABD6CL55_9EURY|nr:AMP-binding protein [Halobellus rarus]
MNPDPDPEGSSDLGSTGESNAGEEYPPPLSDPETVGELVARDRRTSGVALRAENVDRTYSYHNFVTTTYKIGNVLRHLGVRRGTEVLVVPDPLPEPVLTFYGAAQLGAVTRFSDTLASTDPRVVVAPADREAAVDLPPGHHLVVYGDPPTAATTTHWETEVWSENPAVHPTSVGGTDPLLAVGDRTHSHVDALSKVSGGEASERPEAGERVAVQGSFEDPDVVIDGLVEPIAAGATITLTE